MLDDITRTTGLGFSVSQFPVFVLIMFYYKEPEVRSYTVQFPNTTDFNYNIVDFETNSLSPVFLITSAAVAIFATMTTQLQDREMIDNIVEFNEERFDDLFAWNVTQYFIIAIVRVHFIALLCNPFDNYMLVLATLTQTYAITQLIFPKTSYRQFDSFPLILFFVVVFFVFSNIHNKHGLNPAFWVLLSIADLLLILGHTYDVQKNTVTVANCRVFYNCLISGIQILLYTSI
jgi:hypothetical protein